MATERPVLIRTFKAAADLSAKQYHFVEITAANTVNACNAATDIPIGVLQNKPDAAGKPAEVMMLGISKVVADGTLTAGALLGTSADGQGDAKTAGTDTTEYICGRCIVAASGAGEIVECAVNCLSPARAQ